ncbi:MAG: tRNA dihydrouridine synthase DusB [Candidatus Melainabacteria bacterium GWA2_34_9]|nr:MAG: tRNA dihydrouridine synthase DusB [Candidatus Melainabacteria bacterium GWA2_34_9]
MNNNASYTEESAGNLKIGNLQLKSKVVAAPMAGITDTVLRQMIRMFSKDCLLMSEMLSSEALKFNKEQKILLYDKIENPLSFQVSGHKPDLMAEGAKKLEPFAQIIDINMGCPAPKIVKNGDGVKLMTDIPLASSIIKAVRKAVSIPVTVKCRLGWDFSSKNYIEFAKMVENCGADAIIIHGRTKSQMYSGKANWEEIGEVKQAVKIPVIGNGDIDSPEKAKECLEISGCDGIAIGRAIMGDPGLIGRIEKFILTGELTPEPDIKEKLEIALLHCKKEVEHMRNELNGIKFMRKFFACYVTGVRDATTYRADLVRCTKLSEVEEIFEKIRNNLEN